MAVLAVAVLDVGDGLGGIASWDHGFVETHLTLRLVGDELIAAEFNVFKDDSGRSNYRARYKFKKVK